jgi:hypothetical protein
MLSPPAEAIVDARMWRSWGTEVSTSSLGSAFLRENTDAF